jgi:hypothetical protein
MAALLLGGCSKPVSYLPAEGEEPADAAADQQAAYPAPAPAPAPVPQAQVPAGDAVSQDLNSIQLVLENQDYNTAVNQLGAMSAMQGQMTDAQRQAYQQQLWQAQEYLREQAKRDANAQQAYERLGKQMMGR